MEQGRAERAGSARSAAGAERFGGHPEAPSLFPPSLQPFPRPCAGAERGRRRELTAPRGAETQQGGKEGGREGGRGTRLASGP